MGGMADVDGIFSSGARLPPPPWIRLDTGSTTMVPLALGLYALCFGLVSMIIKERLYLSEAFVATMYGVLIGPVCLNLVNPAEWAEIPRFTLEFSRFIIAIQVMAAGVTLPKKYIIREAKSLCILLGPVMTWGWLISGAILMLVFRISLLEALLISACITPTDPVLANSIVQGKFAEKHVPQHVRNLIICESGANDGLGYPFLYFALYFLRLSPAQALGRWFLLTWLWEICLSILVGALIGWVARHLLRYATEHEWIDKESFVSFAIALSLLVLGAVALIGSNDILACFVAGNSFTWDDWFREETKEAHFQEILDMLSNLSYFVYFGTIIPWKQYANNRYEIVTPVRLVAAALLIIVFKRLPMVLAVSSQTPSLRTFRESVFTGWFGPTGVGAMFYCMVSYYELKESGPLGVVDGEFIYLVVTSITLASIIAHGLTISIFYLGETLRNTSIPPVSFVVNRTLTPTAEFLDSVLQLPYKLRRDDDEEFSNAATNSETSPLLPANATQEAPIPIPSAFRRAINRGRGKRPMLSSSYAGP